jgi:hypothetical protein
MSTYLYGRMTRTATETQEWRLTAAGDADTPVQKAAALAQKLAALVPAEVLIIHAAVLAGATKLEENGSTTVTKPEVLKWSLPILAAVCAGLYIIGRLPTWEKPWDFVRMMIGPTAFFAWTLLTGTSAATPWFSGIDNLWLILIGGAIGVLLLGVADRLLPKQPPAGGAP